jgi:hypothetical protein
MEDGLGVSTAGPLTPQEFIGLLRRSVRAGENRQALALADRFSRDLLPRLSPDELDRVGGMIEIAEMAVDLEDWEESQGRVEGAPPAKEHDRVIPAAGG